MLFYKKKIYSYLYIFFLILVFNFNDFSTNDALSKNFIVLNIDVEEKYDLNFDKSKVIDKGFVKAFNTLILKILERKDQNKLKNITKSEVKYLIDNFSIINEKFINQKYKSTIEVHFDRKKILKFLDSKNIMSSLPKEIKLFILPVLIDANKNELYQINQNIFFKNWINVSENYFLINYVLPNEDIEDYLIIKKHLNNLEDYNFEEIVNKYNLDNYIIMIMFKNKKKLNLYSKIKFDNKNILLNKTFKNFNIYEDVSVNELILEIKNIYEDKWKSINKLNTSIALPIRLSIDSKNVELSKKLENMLLNFDLVSDFKIEKFDNNEIIYKIIFNSSPQKFLENIMLSDLKIDTSSYIWKIK